MYKLVEQSDVFVDAALPDHKGQLLFVSLYGRDTSVQQLMARLHQARREGGVDELSLYPEGAPLSGNPLLVMSVGDPRRLEKVTGRLPRGLLGNLVHVWIFDPVLQEVDRAARAGWVLEHEATTDSLRGQAWTLVKHISPVPLLDHWREPVMRELQDSGCLITPTALGPIKALRVELAQSFSLFVSAGVQSGSLAESMQVPG